mgnify:CR=1 FL=1
MAASSSNIRNGFVDMCQTAEASTEASLSRLMREIAEYRVRRQVFRWTRSVEPDDMLNAYVFVNKKRMLVEQLAILSALKMSIAKRAFVLTRIRKVGIPAFSRFFGIPARVP